MASASTTKASFNFKASGTDSELRVVRFHGYEGISDLFEFEIDLVSKDKNIDLEAVLTGTASLRINRGDSPRTFSGVVREFDQLDEGPSYVNYRAVLVPRLWNLALTHQSRIFQTKNIPDILADVLTKHHLTTNDYQLSITKGDYPEREYVVQYQETDLNFVSRWLEHEGICYFFKDEKVIFADHKSKHDFIKGDSTLEYHPATGLDPSGHQSIHALVCRQTMFPEQITLKDYNYRYPADPMRADEPATGGRGSFVEYGNHYKAVEDRQETINGDERTVKGDGKPLAKVRQQEFACRKRRVLGEGDCHQFCAGSKYTLAKHYREEFNQEYLITEVRHFGGQTGAAAEGGAGESGAGTADYRNEFTSIPANVQFRPERRTPKPRLHGAMNAKVDSKGDGEYADVDDKGRYTVIMPFDLSGKSGGHASRQVRMAQPYAGKEYGMHFPLHKGVEVIWTCIDGDPDRPIICGAVPNPETKSPVTKSNLTTSVIKDYARNEIMLDGQANNETIRISCPRHNTSITLGNSIAEYTESDISLKSRDAQIHIEAETTITLHVGDSSLQMDKAGNITLKGKHINLVADQEIRLEVGGSGIQMTANQIVQIADMIDLNP